MEEIPQNLSYSITKDGLAFRRLKNGNTKQVVGSQNSNGYIKITMNINGIQKQRLIHRLVAEAYIPNPDNKPHIDHIDENKSNNRVDNLRWCTPKENSDFYRTKDGRDHYIKLATKRKALLVEYSAKLRKERSELNKANRELIRITKQLEKTQLKLEKKELETIKNLKKFEEYKNKETKKMLQNEGNYTGYKDATGMKFNSQDKMINSTGKKIIVSGQEFASCGTAAQWIVEQESKINNHRKKDTISKELRRYLQGRRGQWIMYNEYTIGY